MIGDSLAGGVGWEVSAAARQTGVVQTAVQSEGGSGLVSAAFFDWPAEVEAQLPQVDPDVVVVILGANDAQEIDGIAFGLPEWDLAYRELVAGFAAQLASTAQEVYWVGMPIMEPAGYRARIQTINALLAQVASDLPGVTFIDIWGLLAGPDGEYARYLPGPEGESIEIRADDGVHYAPAGAARVAAHVFAVISADWGLSG